MSLQLPSTVTDSEFLWMPSNEKVLQDDEEWKKCGRWMLIYPQNDLSWADKAWTDLQGLVSNGSLLLLKASTAALNGAGLIQCYTKRPGQEEVRKAAEAIRGVVPYEYMMFYKSNNKTDKGIASRFGDSNFSQYMHTFLGHFYVREAHRWKFVDTRNKSGTIERKPRVSDAAKTALGLQSLPSRDISIDLNGFSEIDHTLSTAAQRTSSGYFQFSCKLRKEEDGLTEADCVWMVVKSLYENGDFIRIKSYHKKAETAEIRCFVTDYSDSLNLCNICKRIFGSVRFSSIIYFYIQTSGEKPNIKYVFTPQGELYKKQEYTDQRKFFLKFEIDGLDD